MGRKILQNLTKAQAEMPQQATPADASAAMRRTASAPSIGGLREGLDKLASSAIRDIEPRFIEADGLRDRLQISDDDVAALAASIKEHGQQVPILVRPSEKPGHYRVVYGRRRLAAIRLVGGPVKAIVRTLDDKSAVLAQGQENNLRLDPSFIEKAVFVKDMRDAGYNTETIMAALGVSKQSVSTFEVVLPSIPIDVIQAIGPAHNIGRRRWQDIVDAVRDHKVDLTIIISQLADELEEIHSSTERFEVFSLAVNDVVNGFPVEQKQRDGGAEAVHRGGHGSISIDGLRIGKIKASARTVGIEIARGQAPEFGKWIMENAGEAVRMLHEHWKKSGSKG